MDGKKGMQTQKSHAISMAFLILANHTAHQKENTFTATRTTKEKQKIREQTRRKNCKKTVKNNATKIMRNL